MAIPPTLDQAIRIYQVNGFGHILCAVCGMEVGNGERRGDGAGVGAGEGTVRGLDPRKAQGIYLLFTSIVIIMGVCRQYIQGHFVTDFHVIF